MGWKIRYPKKQRASVAHSPSTRWLPSGHIAVQWAAGRKTDAYLPFELPADASVSAIIASKGRILGSTDGVEYSVALDTAGAYIKGPAKVDLGSRYRFLKPDHITGRCELMVRPA